MVATFVRLGRAQQRVADGSTCMRLSHLSRAAPLLSSKNLNGTLMRFLKKLMVRCVDLNVLCQGYGRL